MKHSHPKTCSACYLGERLYIAFLNLCPILKGYISIAVACNPESKNEKWPCSTGLCNVFGALPFFIHLTCDFLVHFALLESVTLSCALPLTHMRALSVLSIFSLHKNLIKIPEIQFTFDVAALSRSCSLHPYYTWSCAGLCEWWAHKVGLWAKKNTIVSYGTCYIKGKR